MKAIAFRVSLLTGLIILIGGAFVFGATSNGSPSYDKVTIFGSPSDNEISNNKSVPEWKYQIPIKLSSATPVADYQVKVILDDSNFNYSKAKLDGGDIRFYDLNGDKLSYWVEEWNPTGISIIWVKIVVPRTSIISMYCGNERATTESNGDATFDFFDDFDGSELDPAKWNIIYNQGTIQVTNGYLRLYRPAGVNRYIQIESVPSFSGGNKIIEYRQKLIPIGVSWYYFSSVYYGTLPNVSSIGYSTYASDGYESALSTQNLYWPRRCGEAANTDGDVISNPPINTWFTEDFIVPPGNLGRILNGTLIEYATRYQGVSSGKIGMVGYSADGMDPRAMESQTDYIYVRNYGENQPPTASIKPIFENPAGVDEEVQFNGVGTDPDGDAIVTYNWNWGDEGDFWHSYPSSVARHSYAAPGTYTVQLRVEDQRGNWSLTPATAQVVAEDAVFIRPPYAYCYQNWHHDAINYARAQANISGAISSYSEATLIDTWANAEINAVYISSTDKYLKITACLQSQGGKVSPSHSELRLMNCAEMPGRPCENFYIPCYIKEIDRTWGWDFISTILRNLLFNIARVIPGVPESVDYIFQIVEAVIHMNDHRVLNEVLESDARTDYDYICGVIPIHSGENRIAVQLYTEASGWPLPPIIGECCRLGQVKYIKLEEASGPPPNQLIVYVQCPVNVRIVDPHGNFVDEDSSTIDSAYFDRTDIDMDGEADVYAMIPNALPGDYQIQVSPQPGADTNAVYSIVVNYALQTHVLADSVRIADIPAEPYSFAVPKYGDANGDGVIDISDVVYLINYLFIHGPAPVSLAAGDATCNGVVDVSDVVYLINYLFISGPAPSC